MDDCLYCRGGLHPHCPPAGKTSEKTSEKTCSWRRCRRCKVTFNPERMRVIGEDGPLEWPHTKPDQATGEDTPRAGA